MWGQALLLCNGEPPSRRLARRLAGESDFIVAADGGAETARKHGITPDVIIGDLDSVSRATLKHFSGVEVNRVPDQYSTDLEKSLALLVTRKIDEVVILGATGRRLDFTLGNFSVIWKYVSRLKMTFAGDGWYAVPAGKALRLAAKKGTVVSLIPFGACKGIFLRRLKYPLSNATMKIGDVGVSNSVTGSSFSVRVRDGHLLVVVLADLP